MSVEWAWSAADAVDRPGERGKPLDSESLSHFVDSGVGMNNEDVLIRGREEDVGSGSEGLYSDSRKKRCVRTAEHSRKVVCNIEK